MNLALVVHRHSVGDKMQFLNIHFNIHFNILIQYTIHFNIHFNINFNIPFNILIQLGNTSPKDREISQGLGFCTSRALGSVLGNTVPWAIFSDTLH